MEEGKTYHYEYTDEKSNKFWEIVLKGPSFTTTYGRIGSKGQQTTKDFDSTEKALEVAEKLAKSKEKKGYLLSE